MRNLSLALCSVLALGLAVPASAASTDYYLVIDGVDGESTTAAKISSWSFGASQPATTTSGASGRSDNPLYVPSGNEHTNPLSQSSQHTVKSPRDAASGLATGRKSGELQAADFKRGGTFDFAQAATADEVGALSVSLSSDAAKTLCRSTHLRTGHIVGSDGTVYDLDQASIACPGQAAGISGGAVAGIVIAARLKHTKTGHVTLMK